MIVIKELNEIFELRFSRFTNSQVRDKLPHT